MSLIRQLRDAAARHRIVAGLLAGYLALSAVEIVRVLLFDRPRTYDAGFYPRETASLPEGAREFAWTRGVTGELLRPLYGPVVRVPLYVARPDIPARGLRVWLSARGRVFDEIVLDRGGWHRFDYYLPPILGDDPWRDSADRMGLAGVADLKPLAGDEPFLQPHWILQRKPDYVRVFTEWHAPAGPPSEWLKVQVESSFQPAAAIDTGGMSLDDKRQVDRRDLGIGVGEPLWAPELPEGGVGLYQHETEGDRPFRWTRGRASLHVPAATLGAEARALAVSLRPAADPAESPVEATFWWGEAEIGTFELTGRSWQPLRLEGVEMDGRAGVLTVRVNRTWNPHRDGGTADVRELGVSITPPAWEG